ncbi:MAG TPA: HAD family hydrolase, partial [Desulfobulbaceae bacterium]|nr:HAD family hydrolase [Desulfobulbaceae bacterium]
MEKPETPWHALSAGEAVRLLQSDIQSGLSSEEVRKRQRQFGYNTLPQAKGKPSWQRFLLQFHQPLIYILIGAGIITAGLREWVDSGVIFGVVLVNAVIGFIQESKAEKALAALADTMIAEATVLRQGVKQRVASTSLVPGDIVLLQTGDKVPADLRLLSSNDLQIDESSLTGESVAVEKQVRAVAEETTLPERINMAYGSSMVTFGRGIGIVTATGSRTEMGRISRLIASAQDLATPLTRKINTFSRILLYIILLLAGITVIVGILRGQSPVDMLMAAVALAVGAIPEGLPAAVTVTLAIGVSRMAKRKAIIRKLPAVETLGSTTVICSDKTGTLTENQMTVQAIQAGGIHYEVSGTGYAPFGRIVRVDGKETIVTPSLVQCLRAGILCNDSLLIERENGWQVQGNPTEGALLAAAAKAGFEIKTIRRQFPRLDIIAFESLHQYMATLHDMGTDNPRMIYVKGAVEQILAKCSAVMDEHGNSVPVDRNRIQQDVETIAAKGLRVLAFAGKEIDSKTREITHEDIADGLLFFGLQAMIDPPRPEAVAAIKVCRTAGIKVKMITGDHPATAAAIAE